MASNAEIIAAIDEAILNWAGKPISMAISGRSTTFRSLVELITARKYYVALNAASGSLRNSIKIAHVRSGGSV